MPELHSNGSYEPYLAQLFNPLAGGGPLGPGVAQFNAGPYGVTGANGIGGAIPSPAIQPQNVWAQTAWATQQTPNPAQSVVAIQLAQQIVARQVQHAIQCGQALQTLLQQVVSQPAAAQAQFGGYGQFPQQQALQQQALQQLIQYLAMQQPAQFRYGMTA